MTTLTQSQWIWNGWSGAPGYTSYYYSSVDDSLLDSAFAAEQTWMALVATVLPSGVTLTPPANYRQVNDTNGDLVGIVPISPAGTVKTGASPEVYAAPAGISVNWLTTTPGPSRLITGRTFLVPVGSAAYQTDGTLKDTTKTALQAAASAFVAATTPILTIWRRPVAGAGGSHANVVGARINDRVSILRSRRS